jgi:hypothetical protein
MSTARIKLREVEPVELVGPEDVDIPSAEERDVTIVVIVGGHVGILRPTNIIYDWFL